jgi:hypothetical protein
MVVRVAGKKKKTKMSPGRKTVSSQKQKVRLGKRKGKKKKMNY